MFCSIGTRYTLLYSIFSLNSCSSTSAWRRFTEVDECISCTCFCLSGYDSYDLCLGMSCCIICFQCKTRMLSVHIVTSVQWDAFWATSIHLSSIATPGQRCWSLSQLPQSKGGVHQGQFTITSQGSTHLSDNFYTN